MHGRAGERPAGGRVAAGADAGRAAGAADGGRAAQPMLAVTAAPGPRR
jgi:hypothetical protein